MKEIHIIRMLRLLGYTDQEMVIREGWVNVSCPLANLNHPSGTDHHPSAGISIDPEGRSVFKCFSCTPDPVPLINMVIQKAFRESDTYFSDLTLFYQAFENYKKFGEEQDEDDNSFSADPVQELKFNFNKWLPPKKKETPTVDKFPDELLEKFPPIKDATDTIALGIKNYLTNVRKISLSSIIEMGIRYRPDRNLIIFPLTDKKGNVQILRARICDERKIMFTITAKHFGNKFQLPTIRESGASLGLGLVNPTLPVIVVESETDCLLLKTYGFNNVIATTTASFSKSQLRSITSPNLWIGFDADEAGRRAARKAVYESNGKLVHIIDWGDAGGKDPGDAANRMDVARAINKKVLVSKKDLTNKPKYARV